ncbi:MAG TPA: glycosyltransferase family 4 protein [Edaphocola sp.]|nr:glycosyltransferase family 4 protein [Edaphocola sp.]
MKILRVINSLGVGGAERMLSGNVPLHIANGFDMDILTLDGKTSFFKEELESKNVKIFSLGTNINIYNPFLIFKIIPFLKKYDIIHVHLFPSIYWVSIAKMISGINTKLIFTEHDSNNRRRNNWILKLVDKIIYNQFEKIITISEGADQNLKKHLKGNYPTQIIYNGIDISKVQSEIKWIDKEFEKTIENKKVLLQIAGFRKQKDQDTVIKSLVMLPEEVIAVFIGEGDRMEECKVLAKNLKVSHRVEFLGLKNNIGTYINLADIVVMSSNWEGFGRSAVEGMALKKPLIATNVSGLNEVVGNAGLLFEVGDVNKLAELITNLLNNKEYYQDIAEKCYFQAKKFDISQMVNAYEKVYNDLLNNGY